MKNSSKNNHSKKNNRQYKKNPEPDFYLKKTNPHAKNNRFLINSSNKDVKNLYKSEKKTINFS